MVKNLVWRKGPPAEVLAGYHCLVFYRYTAGLGEPAYAYKVLKWTGSDWSASILCPDVEVVSWAPLERL